MYKIVGTDGREYGPVTAAEISRWIAERRVEQQTPVWVAGASDWTFLGLLTEFAQDFQPKPVATGPARKTNACAVTGLLLGIAAWLCCCFCYGFPFNLLGLVLSLIGFFQTRQQPEIYEGKAAAVAGIILAVVNVLVFLMLIIIALASGRASLSINRCF